MLMDMLTDEEKEKLRCRLKDVSEINQGRISTPKKKRADRRNSDDDIEYWLSKTKENRELARKFIKRAKKECGGGPSFDKALDKIDADAYMLDQLGYVLGFYMDTIAILSIPVGEFIKDYIQPIIETLDALIAACDAAKNRAWYLLTTFNAKGEAVVKLKELKDSYLLEVKRLKGEVPRGGVSVTISVLGRKNKGGNRGYSIRGRLPLTHAPSLRWRAGSLCQGSKVFCWLGKWALGTF